MTSASATAKSPSTKSPNTKDRAFYNHWHRVDIRMNDLDDQRHVNNAVFAVYCEEGRRAFLEPGRSLIRAENVMTFIARLAIDFHQEMSFPGTVDIGTVVTRIGNSSYTMTQALFTEKGCHATAEVVAVIASNQTRRPIPIPAALREFFSAQLFISN